MALPHASIALAIGSFQVAQVWPRHGLTMDRAGPSVTGSVDQPRSTRVSRRLPAPAARTSGKRSKNVLSPTSPSARARSGPQAEVAAGRERKMSSGIGAFDVKAVRIREHSGIAVGGC